MSCSFLWTIKKTALEAVENQKPVAVLLGEVKGVDPLEIRIDQKLMLESSHLLQTQRLQTLNVGDKVALLRMQGGQKFIILDVIV